MFIGGIKHDRLQNMSRLVKKLSDSSAELRVGIVKAATNSEGDKIASVAFWNEYGTTRIPARPFMRQTFDKHRHDWSRYFKSEVKRVGVINGEFVSVLDVVGKVAAEQMKDVIDRTGDFAPNAPSTIKKKGEQKGREAPPPLIDTGEMSKAIAYEVIP